MEKYLSLKYKGYTFKQSLITYRFRILDKNDITIFYAKPHRELTKNDAKEIIKALEVLKRYAN